MLAGTLVAFQMSQGSQPRCITNDLGLELDKYLALLRLAAHHEGEDSVVLEHPAGVVVALALWSPRAQHDADIDCSHRG